MACWTATNNAYGKRGVAFSSAGAVWAWDANTLRRLDFPGMATVAETIDLGALSSITARYQYTMVCPDLQPMILGRNAGGDEVLVNTVTDSTVHNFGAFGTTGYVPNHATYSVVQDQIFILGSLSGNGVVDRMNPDGTGLTSVWSGGAGGDGKLTTTSDGAVWWQDSSVLYRSNPANPTDVDSIANIYGDGWPLHDPDGPTRVLLPDDPATHRYSSAANVIVDDGLVGCGFGGEDLEFPGISHDGTKGIAVGDIANVVKYWGLVVQPWTVGRVQWGTRSTGWH